MSTRSKKVLAEKTSLHPRNPHRFRYNFRELIANSSELKTFVFVNQFGNETIDFANPAAVKELNKTLLKHFYGIEEWDIPDNYLCPPIPGRADYIHYIADLLASSNKGNIPQGEEVVGLDRGIGANCIYPGIGRKEYGWRLVGTEIDPKAVDSAQKIVTSNQILSNHIEIRWQPSSDDIFSGIVYSNDRFDFTICNPPFHSSAQEAAAKSDRKLKNLGLRKEYKATLNFGGQSNELWCKGGEEAFLSKMVLQSVEIPKQCFWFTSLVSKSASLPSIYKSLNNSNALEVRTITMSQGQKVSRFVAWTFLSEQEQLEWQEKRWK